jgi:lipid-binding SYLF domain-containing protein
MANRTMLWTIRSLICVTVTLGAALPLPAEGKPEEAVARIGAAKTVFDEIMAAPDKGIPTSLLEKAYCVVIVPGAKRAGFIVGGKYGKGVITCKTPKAWSGPSTIRMEGGSFGLQIGAGETDVIMVVMNKSGAERLMSSKFTLGGEAAAMAGPVGRASQAETDAGMKAEILTYSRARGVFGGLTLNGSTLRPDNDDNKLIYGKEVEHKTILSGGVPIPKAAVPLLLDIRKYSGWPAVAGKKKSTAAKKPAAAK